MLYGHFCEQYSAKKLTYLFPHKCHLLGVPYHFILFGETIILCKTTCYKVLTPSNEDNRQGFPTSNSYMGSQVDCCPGGIELLLYSIQSFVFLTTVLKEINFCSNSATALPSLVSKTYGITSQLQEISFQLQFFIFFTIHLHGYKIDPSILSTESGADYT